MTTRVRTNVYAQRVEDVFTKEVVAVNAEDSVQDALRLMVENHVSALPVVNGKEACIGILSATDLMGLTRDLNDDLSAMQVVEFTPQSLIDRVAEQDFGRRRVNERMTEVVETVGPEATLAAAARAMLWHQVHRLPVVDERQRLVGIISTTDIMAAFVDGAPD
jgi:CBS-domain-containing membrane protein